MRIHILDLIVIPILVYSGFELLSKAKKAKLQSKAKLLRKLGVFVLAMAVVYCLLKAVEFAF
jgi:uncharacterized membrane protein YGL010W